MGIWSTFLFFFHMAMWNQSAKRSGRIPRRLKSIFDHKVNIISRLILSCIDSKIHINSTYLRLCVVCAPVWMVVSFHFDSAQHCGQSKTNLFLQQPHSSRLKSTQNRLGTTGSPGWQSSCCPEAGSWVDCLPICTSTLHRATDDDRSSCMTLAPCLAVVQLCVLRYSLQT